jgi:FlaA1/EpsC-like NDP-sugar epimerase
MSPLHHPTWFCRRRLFDEVGGYDARFQAAEDYELLGRVLTRGLRVAKLPEALVRCRFAPGRGISQTRRVEQVRTGLRVKLDYVLANYLTDGIARRCVIWGSREFAGYLAELLADDRYRLSPACLTDFDEQRWGMKIAGLTVVSPDDALGGRQAEDVVITVWNRERERILAFLDSRGCRRNRDYFIFS